MGEEPRPWKGLGVKRPLGKNRNRSSSTSGLWTVETVTSLQDLPPGPRPGPHLAKGWGGTRQGVEERGCWGWGWGSTRPDSL